MPAYFWDVRTSASKPRDVGVVALRRGASIAGWVRFDTAPRGAKAMIELREASVGAAGQQRQTAIWKSTPNARGFFQFFDVPQGVYDVVASSDGWAPGRVEGVRVDEAREYAVGTTLSLHPLESLDVIVSPPVAADGKPWTVQLSRFVTGMITGQGTRATAGLDGRHSFEKLEPGRYRLVVLDTNGAMLQSAQTEIEANTPPPPLFVRLEQVPVRGRVTAGDRPLPARLEFRRGAADVTLQAREDGSFAGMLASEGKWNVYVHFRGDELSYAVRRIDVHRKADEEAAVADIALPAGQITGTVVDDQGKPVQAATVSVMRDNRTEAAIATDDEGAFHLIGVDPGGVVLRAESRSAQSLDTPYTIFEDNVPNVRLVLRHLVKVKVWIATADGRGVPGAMIRYLVAESPDVRPAVTDESGRATLEVPGGASIVTALIMPAGYPIHIAAFPITSDEAMQRITIGTQAAFLNVLTSRGVLPPTIQVPGSKPLALNMLVYPRSGAGIPRGIGSGGFALELDPGSYTLCIPRQKLECQTLSLTAGTQRTIDAREAQSRGATGDNG